MKKAIFTIFSAFMALPAVALAQTPQFGYVDEVVGAGQYYLGVAVTVLMVLMTVWFLWSVFRLIGEKDATKRKDRQKQVLWGLIGLFIAVGVWGIIRIATRVSGVNTNSTFNLTCPPGYHYSTTQNACIVN